MVETITHLGETLAILVRSTYDKPGISFFTPNTFSQQMAYMRHPAGKVITPHIHNPVPREVQYTQEVLILKRGSLKVDFYDEDQNYLDSKVMGAGDVILLIKGGHGFEVLEEIEMFEIKQGPYVGDRDKIRFEPPGRTTK